MARRHPIPHQGNAALLKDLQTEPLEVRVEHEVVALLDTTPDDLSWLPFGVAGVMFMSKAKQLDDDEPLNRNATMLAKKMMHPGLRLGVRGPVVIFRDGPPWGPLLGDHRGMY